MSKLNAAGVAHILLLLIAFGVVSFIVISSFAPFRDKLFSTIFPKPPSRAEGSISDSEITANPVTATFSSQIQIISPAPNKTVTLPLVVKVAVDPSQQPKRVEIRKDNDKKPFVSFRDEPFEATVSALSSGKHTIRANAIDADGNIIMSDEITFEIR